MAWPQILASGWTGRWKEKETKDAPQVLNLAAWRDKGTTPSTKAGKKKVLALARNDGSSLSLTEN